MMRDSMRWCWSAGLRAGIALVLVSGAAAAFGQGYPAKPVRVVVPSQLGGPADVVARALAGKLSESTGQPFITENRAGANGSTGAELVAKAAPDGHTLLLASNAHVTNHVLNRRVSPDLTADLAAVCLVGRMPSVLVVHPSLPAKSVRELIAFGRARPNDLMYASAGGASTSHLAALLFSSMSGVQMLHVPYRGGRLALTEVIGGQVSLTFGNTIVTVPQVRVGRLRALAVTSASRSAAVPDLPTMQEAGLPGYEAAAWFALMAPAGTPTAVINQLGVSVNGVLQSADVKARMQPLGAEAVPSTAAELAQFVRTEAARWEKVIRAAGTALGGDER